MSGPIASTQAAAGTAGRGKKLLVLVTEDWYFVSHRLPVAVAARNAGYDVAIVTRVRDHGDVIAESGLRIIPFEMVRAGINPYTELGTLWRLIRLYRREKPDVAHHVAIKPVLYGSIAARLSGTPRVVNALAGMGWLFSSTERLARALKPVVGWLLPRLLRRGTVLVQNPDDAKLVSELGVPATNIVRIAGAGVDLSKFRYSPEPEGVPVVLLASRLLWDKGVGDFVEAARLLRTQGVAARFVVAGTPDRTNPSSIPAPQLADWIDSGIVESPGWVTDMASLLANSNVVCLPSYYGEGIPKTLLEAAAAGRAIVTTDMPGCREVVRHMDNGLLVPPRDPLSLAEALHTLITDASLREKMGARSRARAEQEFGLDSVIDQTLAMYSQDGQAAPTS